jgi:hypothetical protein
VQDEWDGEDDERRLPPETLARLYHKRADGLEAAAAASPLPEEQAKLRKAAARFRELAAGREQLGAARTGKSSGPLSLEKALGVDLGQLVKFLRGPR